MPKDAMDAGNFSEFERLDKFRKKDLCSVKDIDLYLFLEVP